MADIGNIGFTVDTEGLERGAQALNTYDAAQKNVAAGAQQLNTAQQQTATVTAATVAANQNLATSTGATAQSFSLFGSILNSLTGAFSSSNAGMTSASATARALGTEHESARASTMALREAMYSLAPAAYAAGIPITGLGAIMHAARGGIDILAVAIAGGLVAAMESAADKAQIFSQRMSDILGHGPGGRAFDGLQQSATAANTSMSAMEPTIEALLQSQQKLSNASGFRFFGDIPAQFAGVNQATTAVTAFTQALQLNGETGSAASKSVDSYYQEMLKIDTATGKTTGLTLDLFQKIETESPKAAQLIAQSLGFGSGQNAVAQLTTQLEQASIPIEKFQRGLVGISGFINDLYNAMTPNLSQSFSNLKTSAIELFSVIGRSESVTAFATGLTSLSSALKGIATNQDYLTNFTQSAKEFAVLGAGLLGGLGGAGVGPAAAFTAFTVLFKGDIEQLLQSMGVGENGMDLFSTALKGLIVVGAGAINPFLGLMAFMVEFNGEIQTTIGWIKDLISWEQQLSSTGAVAGAVVGGLAGAAAGALVAGPMGAVAGAAIGATGGSAGGAFAGGGVDQASQIEFDQSAGAIGGTDTALVGFATGGAFTVGGSGGSDSQLVRFMGTPGETVTITPEGLTAPSGLAGADIAGPLTNTMTTTATGQATSAITVAGSPAKPMSANESLANAVAQGTGGLVTTLSGAKVDIVTAVNQMNANVSAALANIATSTKAAAPTAATAAVAGGVKITGDINPTYTAQAKDAAAQEKADAAASAILDKQDAAASALHNAAIDLQNGVATQAEKALYANAPGFDAGNLLGSQGKQAQGSSIVMKQVGIPPNSKSVTGPSFDATSSSFDESGFTSTYNPNGGYAPPNSVTAPDSMMNYGSDYSGPTPYTDSSYYDYASSAATYASPDSSDYYGTMATDYGYYASGTPSGGFTVGGSGGTDSQPVLIHASPGEKVSVGSGESQQDVARHIGRDNQKIEFKLKGATRSQPSFVASISQMRRAFGSI